MKSFWKHFFLDNGDITLFEGGLQKFVPNQINNYKVKHDFVLHIILDGKGSYTVNNHTYQLKANDGFILKKNQRVFYVPDDDDPWTITWIGLGGDNLNDYLKDTMIPAVDVISFEDSSKVFEEMKTLSNFLMKCNPSNRSDYLQLFSKLYQLLYSINREFPLNHKHDNSYTLVESSLAEKIYEYIYDNFLKAVTISDIADYFDISRNYLFKLCKEYYGQSPKQIIQELRMNQASQLLRGSKMQVKEIANIVGYKDAFSFSKMFKEYYHYSPSTFRKLSEEAIDEALFIREEFLENRANKG